MSNPGQPVVVTPGQPMVYNPGQPMVYSGGQPMVAAQGQPMVYNPGQPMVAAQGQPTAYNPAYNPAATGQPVPPGQPVPIGQPMPAPSGPITVGGTIQPVQYLPTTQGGMILMPQQIEVSQTLDHRLIPNHYLVATIVVVLICALLNFTSLVLGIPAIVSSALAYRAVQRKDYKTTKTYGYAAVILSLIDVIYTGVTVSVFLGIIARYAGAYR